MPKLRRALSAVLAVWLCAMLIVYTYTWVSRNWTPSIKSDDINIASSGALVISILGDDAAIHKEVSLNDVVGLAVDSSFTFRQVSSQDGSNFFWKDFSPTVSGDNPAIFHKITDSDTHQNDYIDTKFCLKLDDSLEKSKYIDEIILSARAEDAEEFSALAITYQITKLKAVVYGGAYRSLSVKNALGCVSAAATLVAVHDGARPLIDDEIIRVAVEAAEENGAAACGVRPKCTLKRADENNVITETVDRSEIYEIQTPQIFKKSLLQKAYDAEEAVLKAATDDCSLIERLGCSICVTPGSYRNIKVTTPEDIFIAEAFLGGN